eukprot:3879787-Amphidinium_carterae.1
MLSGKLIPRVSSNPHASCIWPQQEYVYPSVDKNRSGFSAKEQDVQDELHEQRPRFQAVLSDVPSCVNVFQSPPACSASSDSLK